MTTPRSLTLTAAQVIEAVAELEGERLPQRTLSSWAQYGVVLPSVRYDRKRGRAHPVIYNLSDLARVRLVVRLRSAGISMQQARSILAYVDAALPDVLKPKTRAVLVVEGWRARIAQPGRPDVDVPSGQMRLPLAGIMDGLAEAAREARKTA